MPRSRSWSIESMTRSVTTAPSRNVPACRSIASTSVVLPWSTCAMMATLRRSSRVAVGSGFKGPLGARELRHLARNRLHHAVEARNLRVDDRLPARDQRGGDPALGVGPAHDVDQAEVPER